MRSKPLPGGLGPIRAEWHGYALALVLAAVALGLRQAAAGLLGGAHPFALSYVATACVAARYGGGPGAVAAVVGVLAAWPLANGRAGAAGFESIAVYALGSAALLVALRSGVGHRRRRSDAASRALLEAVLDATPAGIIVADASGRIVRMNPANHRLWGRAPFSTSVDEYREWKGWWADNSARHGQRLGAHDWALARALRGQVVPGDIVAIEPFGAPEVRRTMINCGAPVWDENGIVAGAVIVQMDITDRVHAELALQESQARLQTLADNITQLAWMADENGSVFWFNRRWYDYTGATPEQMANDGWRVLHHPEHEARVLQKYREHIRSGDVWEDTFPLRARDGVYHWFLSRAMPIRDQTGRITRWFGTNTDITEWRDAQQEIATRARQQRAVAELGLRALREQTLEPLLAAAAETLAHTLATDLASVLERVADGSTVALRAGIGWKPGIIGRHVSSGAGSAMEYMLRAEEPVVFTDLAAETRFAFSPLLPEHGVVSGLACAIRATDGRSWGGLGVFCRTRRGFSTDDVHFIQAVANVLSAFIQRREVEEQLAAAKRELQAHADQLERTVAERTGRLTETVHELERFSYSLSHDMRAPLRAMKGFAQVLALKLGPQMEPESRRYLDRIVAAADRLDQLIQDVLSYSKVVRDEVALHAVDVEALAHQLVDENPMFQPPEAQITFRDRLEPVKGHEAYVTQVLSNLLGNAVKFSRRGEIPRVELWTESSGDRIRFSVRDHGIGIPADWHGRIFGMFERLHSSKEYEGTGIGLAIVRKAVERMNGACGVESAPGQGSTFWFELEKP